MAAGCRSRCHDRLSFQQPDVQVHATLACAGMAALARDRADGEAGLVRLYPRQT